MKQMKLKEYFINFLQENRIKKFKIQMISITKQFKSKTIIKKRITKKNNNITRMIRLKKVQKFFSQKKKKEKQSN